MWAGCNDNDFGEGDSWKRGRYAREILGKEIDLLGCSTQLVKSYSDIFRTTFSPIDLESLAEDVESKSGGYEI